ncbi:MAG: DNA primase [bacterium]|nr:DNA primase [bacterium]
MNNQDTIIELRSKIDIVDLISEYIPLVQKGKNYFGVCPFHNDTNPSMSVSREKQIYKCFSCGASGNVFNFICDYENVSFTRALEIVAEKVGYKLNNTYKPKIDNNDKFYDMYDLAMKFYQNNINTPAGREAKKYLNNRSIDSEIIKNFNIGYSLDKNNTLITLLTKKGFSYKDIVDMGLGVDNHDIYIDRIMFPLYDSNGRVVAFSGRIYGDSSKNKYVNSKETKIFKKGHCLYNFHIAKESARKEGYVIVMEGFMDVIRASTIGLTNVVALMGTALTNEQITLLRKLSLNIILCFDGDNAGHHATMAVGKQLETIGINPKVINLDNSEDPDSYILKYGKEKFYELVDSAISFSDYKIANLKNGVNFNSDLELSQYVDNVLRETSLIKDEIRREIILKKLAIETNLMYNTLEKRLANYVEKSSDNNAPVIKKQKSKYSRYEKAVHALIYSLLEDNTIIDKCVNNKVYFSESSNRNLYNEILYYYEKYGIVNIADMYTYLVDKKDLLDLFNNITNNDDYDISDTAINDYIEVIKGYNKKQEIKRLNELLRSENSILEKAKIAEQIRLIKIGEN